MIKSHLVIDSIMLARPVAVHVYLPYTLVSDLNKAKIFWCFHCALKDGSMFSDELGLARYVDSKNVVLVAPDLPNSFFSDNYYESVGSFISCELIPKIAATFSLPKEKKQNFGLGISMGAFGCLNFALNNPEVLSEVFCMSGIYDFTLAHDDRIKSNPKQKNLIRFLKNLLPTVRSSDGTVKPECDIKKSIETYLKKREKNYEGCALTIHLFSGDSDYLSFNQTHTMKELLKINNIHSEIKVDSGEHSVEYWNLVCSFIFDN